MAVAVREDVRIGRHLFDRGEVALECRVAQPHRRLGVDRPERQVLGHAFHEPERRIHCDQCLHAGTGVAAAVDVVLELVDHLVLQHVLELGVRAGERQHRTVFEELRDAAQSLTGGVDDVRLLEIGLRGVQDDRLAALELVMQDARQTAIRAFRHACRVERAAPLIRVVVDVEVFGLNRLEVEVLVLHLVLAEVLRSQRLGRKHEERRTHRHTSHCEPPSSPAATTGASPHSRSS